MLEIISSINKYLNIFILKGYTKYSRSILATNLNFIQLTLLFKTKMFLGMNVTDLKLV